MDYTLATFVTGLRAASLVEALQAAGIQAVATSPRWTNKHLPPPRIAVLIAEADTERAQVVAAAFANGGAR